MKTAIIIPARYASTRFPGKPLAIIHGKSMIQRVVEQCMRVEQVDHIVVATDDERIANHVQGLGHQVVLTRADHPSGTDRCCEAASMACPDADIIVNVQGDEPFIQPQQIEQVIQAIRKEKSEIATLAIAMKQAGDPFDPNKVKVVFDQHGRALLFSRSAIPYVRNHAPEDWMAHAPYFKHIGLYAFRHQTLRQLVALPPSKLEMAESLEQLRWLEAGYRIQVLLTESESKGIDTPEDLEEAQQMPL